ncbi:pentatricopeptide repeat-containing protein At1g43980, mitochondrial [Apium graveolens]|uniref:pentatricopeptide repeat-containing protein At1g43980, mitochondrial n=1 Tax=Apium graveolens TaxID=4045 RepID=UPI003D7BABA8
MYQSLRKCHTLHKSSSSYVSHLINHCLHSKSLTLAKFIHAHLIKIGLNHHTFQGNYCVNFYSKLGSFKDSLLAFDDIEVKNVVSWNICLRVFVKFQDLVSARKVFDEMPERDVVSWNSMVSGYVENGFGDCGFEVFRRMQSEGVRPSGFTYSILVSCVGCGRWGKEIHGNMIRSGVDLCNVVVGNSLIDMYGKLGLLDYAFGVFLCMEELDVISWNSLLSGCCKSGQEELALSHFCTLREIFFPDEFTISMVSTACSNLQDLGMGKQILCISVKLGFLSNTIVSSAMIDMFSKCNRVEDAVYVFEYVHVWDSAVCNSMISSYARNGSEEVALELFVLTLRKDIKPTEFTLSCVISCASVLHPIDHGSQFHCLVVRLGFDSDYVVASSLVEMYSKYGQMDFATMIFDDMCLKDLISWNTMILGLTCNGKVSESLELFKELLERGPPPDHVTMTGVLSACNYGGFVDEGMSIFALMEKQYGVKPVSEHYVCIVDMIGRAGHLEDALNILETTPFERKVLGWISILYASEMYNDLKFMERASERILELEPQSSLPYMVLAKAYERRGRWESLVRVKKLMEKSRAKEVAGFSSVGIRNCVYMFKENQLLHCGGKDIYLTLRLLEEDLEHSEKTGT